MKKINLVSLKVCKEKTIFYNSTKISDDKKAFEVIKDFIGDSDREYFGVLMLSNCNEINAIEICSVGTLDSTVVSPREVFKGAMLNNASKIILFHIHPSGNVQPSKADKEVTELLLEVSNIIGIPVIDHIIVGMNNFYSFSRNGIIFGKDDLHE